VYCAVLLLVVQFVKGQADKQGGVFSCYQCDNFNDKGCGHGDDVDRKYIRPCKNVTGPNDNIDMYLPPGKQFHLCRKITTIIDFDVNGNKATERIKRTCGYENSTYDEVCYYRAGLGGRVNVCSCKEAECNQGTNLMPTTLGLCLALVVASAVAKSLNHS